jgi:hypothetical protein
LGHDERRAKTGDRDLGIAVDPSNRGSVPSPRLVTALPRRQERICPE